MYALVLDRIGHLPDDILKWYLRTPGVPSIDEENFFREMVSSRGWKNPEVKKFVFFLLKRNIDYPLDYWHIDECATIEEIYNITGLCIIQTYVPDMKWEFFKKINRENAVYYLDEMPDHIVEKYIRVTRDEMPDIRAEIDRIISRRISVNILTGTIRNVFRGISYTPRADASAHRTALNTFSKAVENTWRVIKCFDLSLNARKELSTLLIENYGEEYESNIISEFGAPNTSKIIIKPNVVDINSLNQEYYGTDDMLLKKEFYFENIHLLPKDFILSFVDCLIAFPKMSNIPIILKISENLMSLKEICKNCIFKKEPYPLPYIAEFRKNFPLWFLISIVAKRNDDQSPEVKKYLVKLLGIRHYLRIARSPKTNLFRKYKLAHYGLEPCVTKRLKGEWGELMKKKIISCANKIRYRGGEKNV